MSVIKFVDNDPGYLQWLQANPRGYVLNTYRQPSPNYLIIHRANKGCVSKLQSGAQHFTKDYIKVCSLDLTELNDWARQNVGGHAKTCGNCRP